MKAALKLIRADRDLLAIEGAGHDLAVRKTSADVTGEIAKRFLSFTRVS
jgi:hypothetical protein